jgi:hypothetical protein
MMPIVLSTKLGIMWLRNLNYLSPRDYVDTKSRLA